MSLHVDKPHVWVWLLEKKHLFELQMYKWWHGRLVCIIVVRTALFLVDWLINCLPSVL